jgi:hypothetical protein
MFRPNQTCIINISSGKTDVYGQPLPARRSKERCAVVKLELTNLQTSVRTDSSASRGNAMEVVTNAILLFPKTTIASIDDLIEIAGAKLKIVSKHPRYSVAGDLDHYEIGAVTWS